MSAAEDRAYVRRFLQLAQGQGKLPAARALEAFDRLSVTKDEVEVPMVRVRTNAPMAYDYGYCVQVQASNVTSDELRLFGRFVDMPLAHVEYQCDRYRSGSYFVQVQS